jgi:hypothetical protein
VTFTKVLTKAEFTLLHHSPLSFLSLNEKSLKEIKSGIPMNALSLM